MYCYTYLNHFPCTFNELQLWTRISSEHTDFLKTVASLSNVALPKVAVDNLDEIHRMFAELYDQVVSLKKAVDGSQYIYTQHVTALKQLIDRFILHDTHVVKFYPQLLTIGISNKAWLKLVKHIISEQTFMLEMFKDLRQQLA